MTDRQRERIKNKIKLIKQTLNAEKRKFGGFDDSAGRRYSPTGLYLQIEDYEGGLRYFRWFQKNFPDDMGFPGFLFESTVILFKTAHIDEAESYALKTYFSNRFLLDTYFENDFELTDKGTSTNYKRADYLANFNYRHNQDELLEFSAWLNEFRQSNRFVTTKKEIDKIEEQLETEPVGPKRSELVKKLYRLT